MRNMWIVVMLGLCAVGFQTAHRSDFSGKWKLDQKKSKNLPSSFHSVQRYVMTVQQNADSLVAIATMTGSGQTVTLPPMTYIFDGKELYTNDSLRSVQRWTSAEWASTGTKLIVHKRTILKTPVREDHSTQTDVWALRNSSTLIVTVSQKFETGDSTHSEERVYRRVK